MTRQAAQLITTFLTLLVTAPASALEYKSLAENAVAYDACSTKAQPLFILLKGTPVEVIVSIDKWIKIREQTGGLGCIESRLLTSAQQVIVTDQNADVLTRADPGAPVVFSVVRGVVLEALEKPSGIWLKVRHRDGQTGFIPLKSVWGI